MKLRAVMSTIAAWVICGPALLMPYRVRVMYGQSIAWAVHMPSVIFGRLARLLLRKLDLSNPYPDHIQRP